MSLSNVFNLLILVYSSTCPLKNKKQKWLDCNFLLCFCVNALFTSGFIDSFLQMESAKYQIRCVHCMASVTRGFQCTCEKIPWAPSSWLVLWQLSIKIYLNGLRQVCSNEYKCVSSMQNELALRQPAFTVVILTVCVRYAQVDSFTLAISHKLHFVNQPPDSIFPSVSVLLWGFQMLPLSPGAV